MRTWMDDLSRRDPRLAAGCFFGVWMAVWTYVETRSVSDTLVEGLLSSVIFGALMGPFLARQRARSEALIGDVPAPDRAVVSRAARSGPVPVDPHLLAAATRLTQHRLEQSRRTVKTSALWFGLLTVLAVGAALTSTSWWWLVAPVSAYMLVGSLLEPRRLERRLALLQAERTHSSQG